VLELRFIAMDPDDYFADVARASPLRNADEGLERCLRCLSFG
jgi:hypothetical protein